jgi:hypothetical protein
MLFPGISYWIQENEEKSNFKLKTTSKQYPIIKIILVKVIYIYIYIIIFLNQKILL